MKNGKDVITPEEFAFKMQVYIDTEENAESSHQYLYNKYDKEDMHRDMDNLMCKVLKSLGYEEGVTIFEKALKWYS